MMEQLRRKRRDAGGEYDEADGEADEDGEGEEG
jgi:hypothetical protein